MDNGRQPATKQDLADLEKRLSDSFAAKFATKQDLADLEKRLTERLTESFLEGIHDAETRILTAYYTVAELDRRHLTDLDRSNESLRERFSAIEMRILEIEKRLNIPPARQ